MIEIAGTNSCTYEGKHRDRDLLLVWPVVQRRREAMRMGVSHSCRPSEEHAPQRALDALVRIRLVVLERILPIGLR